MVSHKVSITLVLFFCINLISTNIYASNVGGWSMSNPVAKGASTVYTGIKNITLNGADYVKKGTAIVTPTATGVAKVLARGAAGYALSVAVEQLLGSVDWVLDPANNQIVYTKPNENGEPPVVHTGDFYSTDYPDVAHAQNFNQLCNNIKDYVTTKDRKYIIDWSRSSYSVDSKTGNATALCRMHLGDPTNYWVFRGAAVGTQPANPAEEEKKTLPLDVVAQKVISNAAGGDAAAQQATTAAAADIVAEAEKDDAKARPIAQQLESSSQTKPSDEAAAEKANEATGTQTQNPTKPDTTDLKLEFPIFCDWAPTVCEAAQTVISFPKTLTNWWETGKSKAEEWSTSISESWTAVKDWVKEEPSKDKEDNVDIEEQDLEQKTVDLNFGSACPAPVVLIDSTFYDQPFKIEYSFNDFCSILSDFVRPVLIAMGAFIAALILGGVKTNE